MTDDIRRFAADFPDPKPADWFNAAVKAIKGADVETSLVIHSEDGIALGPLFVSNPHSIFSKVSKSGAPHLEGRPWHIGTLIDFPDIKTANADILEDLKGGASSVLIDPAILRSKSDVERLLDGVHCNLAPIALVPGENNYEASALLAAHFQSDSKLNDIYVSLGYAPEKTDDHIVELATWVKSNAPHWKAFSANARAAHEAGGSPAQELALMLTMGARYIPALIASGFSPDDAVSLIDISLAGDQDGHQGIFKFRAARLLWAKMAESFGASQTSRNCHIHAISSERMMAKQDPWSNMIRLSSASFGAVCGGADTITLLPFTHALGAPTAFGRRISRNIQLMMMEESHLGQVSDPAHGSFMHENLTVELAEKAWGIFQHMQSIDAPLDWLAAEIAKTNLVRQQKIDSNEILLVGVNQFAKSDVRKARIRRVPDMKARKGDIMTATPFDGLVAQVDDGKLSPLKQENPVFRKIRLSNKYDGQEDA